MAIETKIVDTSSSGGDSPNDGNSPSGGDSPGSGDSPSGGDTQEGGDSPGGGNSPGDRRLLSQLTENDCKNLKTSNDNKYQCILSSDKSKCLEDEKSISYHIKLSFVILSILFLI